VARDKFFPVGLLVFLWVFFFCSIQQAAAENTHLSDFQPPFKGCEALLKNSPKALIDAMNKLDDTALSAVARAQKNFCLGAAYLALIYPDKALAFVEAAYREIDEPNEPWLFHTIQILQAEAMDASGNPALALQKTNEALSWAQNVNNRTLETSALRMRGMVKTSLGDYLGALQDLNEAYEFADANDEEFKIGIASYLALVYEYREEYELAIPYFENAANYYRKKNVTGELSIALYGLGHAHIKLGNHDIGEKYLEESLQLAESIGDDQGAAYAIKELAYNNIKKNNFQTAEEQLNKAILLSKDSGNPYLNINIYLYLADLFLAKGDTAKAEATNATAAEYIDIKNMPILYLNLETQRAKISAARGYYKSSYEKIASILDEKVALIKEQSSNQMLQIRAQYEMESKEKENHHLQNLNRAAEAELKTERSRNVLLLLLLATVGIISVLLAYIVARNREVRKKLEQMANLDGLTGVPNRRRTMELIDHQLKLSHRHKYPLAVGILDLDNFKAVNDNFGHPVGDKVLEAFGLILRNNMRATDIVGRIGGEEFIIALPHTTITTAMNVIDQLRIKSHKVPELIDDHRFVVSFSCGLCEATQMESLSEVLAAADGALYNAKQNGRDRVEITQPDQPDKAR